jgi:hypothetical protein
MGGMFFKVDLDVLDNAIKTLGQADEAMQQALTAMSQDDGDGYHIGTDALDGQVNHFQSTWHYGMSQLTSLIKETTEGLRKVYQNYEQLEEGVTQALNSIDKPLTEIGQLATSSMADMTKQAKASQAEQATVPEAFKDQGAWDAAARTARHAIDEMTASLAASNPAADTAPPIPTQPAPRTVAPPPTVEATSPTPPITMPAPDLPPGPVAVAPPQPPPREPTPPRTEPEPPVSGREPHPTPPIVLTEVPSGPQPQDPQPDPGASTPTNVAPPEPGHGEHHEHGGPTRSPADHDR